MGSQLCREVFAPLVQHSEGAIYRGLQDSGWLNHLAPTSAPGSGAGSNGEDKGRNGKKNSDNYDSAHHVAEKTNRQGERSREFTDDIERQHDHCWLDVGLDVANNSLFPNAKL